MHAARSVENFSKESKRKCIGEVSTKRLAHRFQTGHSYHSKRFTAGPYEGFAEKSGDVVAGM